MEEVTGRNVQIVLSVKEGKGFDQILQPTLIVGTLNGHSLETDVTEINSNPEYATDLVWEVEKSMLKRMRSSHTPVKLECFAIKDNDRKEKIGYILLNVRSAEVLPKDREVNGKLSWHRLLGLRNDIRMSKPELLLALSVKDQNAAVQNALEKIENLPENDQNNLEGETVKPCLLSDKRLIQLGPADICQNLFLLTIIASSAEHLDALLPQQFDKTGNTELIFWYQILENDVQLKPIKLNYGHVSAFNEKVVIRIRSSLSMLRDYLQQKPYMNVFLKHGNDTIGQSKVDLRPLLPTHDREDFLVCAQDMSSGVNERCILKKTENGTINTITPHIDLQLKLQYLGKTTDSTIQTGDTAIQSGKRDSEFTGRTEITSCRKSDDDFVNRLSGPTRIPNSHVTDGQNEGQCSLNCVMPKSQLCKIPRSQSTDIQLRHNNKKDCSCDYSKRMEAYRLYCLNVSVMAIQLSSLRQTIRNIEFRFHHPKAEIVSTLYPKTSVSTGEKVKLQDIRCKLHFISSANEIERLLTAYPPKFSICDATGDPRIFISQSVLNTEQLFRDSKLECHYEIPLYDAERKKIGNVDVTLTLEDHGTYYGMNTRTAGEHLGPPIVDDALACEIINELETWKERQKEMFKVELKKKEERHLSLLSEEWQKHRETLESKLACSVEQCKMLANSLNNATEDLRTRRLKSLEKEARLIKANEDLQWRYETKLQELEDSFRTMEENLMSKINVLEEKNTALETQVKTMSTENETLRSTVKKQSEELETYRKGSLTQDQTASLLQEVKILEEKLHSAQNSKAFFKEQWGKAVREIHRMKKEYQQAMEVQIKNSQEELKNLDLEEMLYADSTALKNDRVLLDQIQKEIDVIRPTPSLFRDSNRDHSFAPIHNSETAISHSTNKLNSSNKFGEYQARLRDLVAERDSLLKTGSYTNDDAVIRKLNIEIQALAINS